MGYKSVSIVLLPAFSKFMTPIATSGVTNPIEVSPRVIVGADIVVLMVVPVLFVAVSLQLASTFVVPPFLITVLQPSSVLVVSDATAVSYTHLTLPTIYSV